ncbi:unnamed protein product [Ilex paraguariensis]|uniref:BOD1/SHG1 domain-containing protein n=1 Tax=Ilex paraguariensis TaxID=185542 RepID=A0ABC8TUK8_9AQUA
MENGGGVNQNNKISADDVISKLKDDGDFDRLRLKIIRKLKENEEIRNSIVSMVKQSAALNRPGSETMKPRQLSDAIHEEVRDKVMSQISDGVWDIIRSADGMKSEITETVHSVYSKLLNPKINEDGGSSSHNDMMPVQKGLHTNQFVTASTSGIDGTLSDSEPKEPPGFSEGDRFQNNNQHEEQPKAEMWLPIQDGMPAEEQKEEHCPSQDVLEPDGIDLGAPPGFSAVMELKKPCDGSDEDPDVPPGFG